RLLEATFHCSVCPVPLREHRTPTNTPGRVTAPHTTPGDGSVRGRAEGGLPPALRSAAVTSRPAHHAPRRPRADANRPTRPEPARHPVQSPADRTRQRGLDERAPVGQDNDHREDAPPPQENPGAPQPPPSAGGPPPPPGVGGPPPPGAWTVGHLPPDGTAPNKPSSPHGTQAPMSLGASLAAIFALLVIGGSILAAIGWGAWWIWTNTTDNTTSDGTVERLAEYACEDAVKNILKAPSTAKFSHDAVNGDRDTEL